MVVASLRTTISNLLGNVMKTRYLITLVAAALVMAAASSPNAGATPISGSITLSSGGVIPTSLNGTNLSNSTKFELVGDSQTTGLQTGDFTSVPIGSVLPTSTTGEPGVSLDLSNITAFTFGNAAFGTFDAMSLIILTQTATNLDIFVTGTFVPGTDFPAGSTAPLGASDHISLNETGVGANESISWGATFASPPAAPPTVPEPAPLFLIGTGLCLMVLLRSRNGVRT
jgi:hypothetical protein